MSKEEIMINKQQLRNLLISFIATEKVFQFLIEARIQGLCRERTMPLSIRCINYLAFSLKCNKNETAQISRIRHLFNDTT